MEGLSGRGVTLERGGVRERVWRGVQGGEGVECESTVGKM